MSAALRSRPRYLRSNIDNTMDLSFLERKGSGLFFTATSSLRVQPPPHRRGAHTRNVAGRHQQLCLICFQPFGRGVRFWPPNESSFRQRFCASQYRCPSTVSGESPFHFGCETRIRNLKTDLQRVCPDKVVPENQSPCVHRPARSRPARPPAPRSEPRLRFPPGSKQAHPVRWRR